MAGAGYGISDGSGGFVTKLEGDGDAKIGDSSGDVIQVTGSLEVNGDIKVNEYIYHNGDADTFIRFQDDSINFQAGGKDYITITEAATDEVVINENSTDIDFRVESNHQTHMFYIDGGNNRIGIGTSGPQFTLDVQERTGVDAVLRMMGSTDVGIRLAADSDDSGENDNPYIEWYQDGHNSNSRNNRLVSVAMEGDANASFDNSLGNGFFIDAYCPNAINSPLRTIQIANDSEHNGHKARITVEGEYGHVGIWTNAPSHPLEVEGAIKAITNITAPTTQDLGSGTTSTLSIGSSLMFLDADSITSADIGGGFQAHVLTIPNGTTSGQRLTLVIEGNMGAGDNIPIMISPTNIGGASDAFTPSAKTSLNFVYYSTAAISAWYQV